MHLRTCFFSKFEIYEKFICLFFRFIWKNSSCNCTNLRSGDYGEGNESIFTQTHLASFSLEQDCLYSHWQNLNINYLNMAHKRSKNIHYLYEWLPQVFTHTIWWLQLFPDHENNLGKRICPLELFVVTILLPQWCPIEEHRKEMIKVKIREGTDLFVMIRMEKLLP